MKHRAFAEFALVLTALFMPIHALAKADKETPGAPCLPGRGVGTGNPCNGNNGNPSPEGNADGGTHIDRHPDPFTIARPADARGAYIDQIGATNAASIGQSTSSQYARIAQTGDGNTASVTQSGSGSHYALAEQTGDANALEIAQNGVGDQVAFAAQRGDRNVMLLNQQGGFSSSGAELLQQGNDNLMSLAQNGDGNQARLIQDGSGNAMTAVQNGDNNQLTWTQTGDNLSNLGITQSGGQAISVTQSR